MNINTEVSIGEFLDKMTILQIKSERIEDPAKLENIRRELGILTKTWEESPFSLSDVASEVAELKKINEKLWVIEDDIRLKEAQSEFDEKFIELARSVYFTNDDRSAVKRAINMKLGSEIIEEKSYADYRTK